MNIELNTRDKTEIDLRESIAKKLMFPSYYGKNWDAFDECINDLGWITADKITLTLQYFDSTKHRLLYETLLEAQESRIRQGEKLQLRVEDVHNSTERTISIELRQDDTRSRPR